MFIIIAYYVQGILIENIGFFLGNYQVNKWMSHEFPRHKLLVFSLTNYWQEKRKSFNTCHLLLIIQTRLPHMCQFYNKYSTYSCVSYWLHLYLLSLDQQAGLYSVILKTNIDVLAFCVFAITKIKCREISPFKTHEINCRWIFSFELDNKSWVWSYLKTNGTQ